MAIHFFMPSCIQVFVSSDQWGKGKRGHTQGKCMRNKGNPMNLTLAWGMT
jgi:hypothetical protein